MAQRLGLQMFAKLVMWTPYRLPLTKLVRKLAGSSGPPPPTLFINFLPFLLYNFSYIISFILLIPNYYGHLLLICYISLAYSKACQALWLSFPYCQFTPLGLHRWNPLYLTCALLSLLTLRDLILGLFSILTLSQSLWTCFALFK